VGVFFSLGCSDCCSQVPSDQTWIELEVPSDAHVSFNGQLIQTTGHVRRYTGYGLKPGRKCLYELVVEVERNGESLRYEENIVMRTGELKRLSLPESSFAARPRTPPQAAPALAPAGAAPAALALKGKVPEAKTAMPVGTATAASTTPPAVRPQPPVAHVEGSPQTVRPKATLTEPCNLGREWEPEYADQMGFSPDGKTLVVDRGAIEPYPRALLFCPEDFGVRDIKLRLPDIKLWDIEKESVRAKIDIDEIDIDKFETCRIGTCRFQFGPSRRQ